jgi:hypothetical protein
MWRKSRSNRAKSICSVSERRTSSYTHTEVGQRPVVCAQHHESPVRGKCGPVGQRHGARSHLPDGAPPDSIGRSAPRTSALPLCHIAPIPRPTIFDVPHDPFPMTYSPIKGHLLSSSPEHRALPHPPLPLPVNSPLCSLPEPTHTSRASPRTPWS